MIFGIGTEVDTEAQKNTNEVQLFSDELTHLLSTKEYGDGLLNYYIGFICVKAIPGYEDWHKERKPKFRSIEKVKKLDGSIIELKNTYSYDIKLSSSEYEQFVSNGAKQAVKLFADVQRQLTCPVSRQLS